jgi:hypothetical protein
MRQFPQQLGRLDHSHNPLDRLLRERQAVYQIDKKSVIAPHWNDQSD